MWNCETELHVLQNQLSIKFYKWRDNDLSLIEQKVDTRNTTLAKYSSGDPPFAVIVVLEVPRMPADAATIVGCYHESKAYAKCKAEGIENIGDCKSAIYTQDS